ncbi:MULTISPECIES: transglutaminase domain-containing protein [Maribacter]|uniref:Transglutaminase domain-containing protein n=1 Tax=Maribacter flavus TaxID=1658664 RepID=A0ABU7IHY5_9FLAO|nr:MULTISPECIES: transglutaminase domain-containing protein [Maribacter]MDC6404827.1 transglutaminase domain-containing protein [Maribacter sp. PR66]MEE1972241.1 transglutaminase domain-containing protein [Maribacter flavus]
MRLVFLLLLFYHAIGLGQFVNLNESDFSKADSISFSYKGHSLRNLPVLTYKLTKDLTKDVEKFRAIFTWVCTNIENDYQSYLKTRKKRKRIQKDRAGFLEWNQSFTPKVFEKLVSEKRTACTGYAYLIKEMANLAGFQSKIVNGYGRTPTLLLSENDPPNHSWNTVQLDDQWYLCDATWAAGRIMLDADGPRFEADYDDVYFLPNPELFAKNHYPLESELSLLEELPTLTDFIVAAVIYKASFRFGIAPILPEKMHQEVLRDVSTSFELKIPEGLDVKKFRLALNNGGKDVEVQPKIIFLGPGKIQMDYTFNRTGLYDTHIVFNGDKIATYVVKVRRN